MLVSGIKMIQLYKYVYMYVCVYTYIYIFFFRFFSIIGYYKILNIVPCTFRDIQVLRVRMSL